MDLASRKAALRADLAARRRAVSAASAASAAEGVARRLADARELADCRRLALYAAADGELPVDPLARLAEARGLALLWPRVAGASLELAACAPGELQPGYRGIAEPPPRQPAVALGPGDVVLVPGLAFDAAGGRLGRGGGYYDRLLAGLRGPIRVGVGYDFQLVELVPAGEGDERVDMVVTEKRLLRTRR